MAEGRGSGREETAVSADGFTFNVDAVICGNYCDPQGPDGGTCGACGTWVPESELERDPLYTDGYLCPQCFFDAVEALEEEAYDLERERRGL